MVTWENTINIIETMFDAKDKDIAKQLGVPATSLSHVKRGHRPPSDHFNPSWVYRKIFDPTEKKSMAACDPKYMKPHQTKPENIEKEYLSDLKRIIEIKFPNVQSDMAYCWNVEDYRTFVLELLKLTNLGTNSKSPSNNDDESAPVADMPLDSSSSQACVPPPLAANTSEQSPDGATRGSQIVDEVSDSTPGGQAVSRSESGETESKAVSQSSDADTVGGAQLHVEDKYKCCRFCTKWRGVTGDELAICRVLKEQRNAASGRDCKYYRPDWGQITIEMM